MPNDTRPPAFQCYAADVLADKNVIVMTTEEFGAYWLLILVCWREGELPNDVEELALIARMPTERFQPSWEKRIRRCFEQRETGEWIHGRLEVERHRQAENRAKKQHAALVRHYPDELPRARSRRNADAMQMQCPSSSASSSASAADHSTSDEEKTFASAASAAPATGGDVASGEAKGEIPKQSAPRKREPQVCDEVYLDELQADPAFKALDVRLCHAKMLRWCKERKKQPTRQRLVAWLMREDQPMNGNGTKADDSLRAAIERRAAERAAKNGEH
jgi:uncharacterized protein YdaU (DUF1376 family)